ncbi:MAG TPA: hypothetical protein VIA63_05750 [Candidatus Limnocylindria bacterium]|jgi:hypothetical protein
MTVGMDASAASAFERTVLTRPDAGRAIQRARALAWGLWFSGVVFSIVAFLLILATFSVELPSRGFGFRGWVPLVAVLWATVGARIAARQPQNSVGWLILACGWLWSVNGLFEEYSTFAYYPQEIGLPFVETMVWFDGMVGSLVAGLSALALLVVPDGSFRSRRWAFIGVAAIVVATMAVLTLATLPRRLVPFPFDNPYAIDAWRAYEPAFPSILRAIDVARGLAVLVPTAALLSRVAAAKGARREQLKWVAAPATFASVGVFLYAFIDHPIVEYWQLLGLVLVPIGFAIAMRRHRLYDIDRLLNRTIVLGAATALLAGVYTASIGLMQRIFILVTGERSDAAVILTTLLVAAAFAPLRDRLQAFVKRNFGASVAGTHGLEPFVQEIDDHLRLSDRDGLLAQLLAESVDSLGAMNGALEVTDQDSRIPRHVIGPWSGDTHLVGSVYERGRVVARVLLGPRLNGTEYNSSARARLERAVHVVGLALDRIPRSRDSLETPVPDAGA